MQQLPSVGPAPNFPSVGCVTRTSVRPPVQGYLLSCALDGSVKVWAPCDTPHPNAVLEATPSYSHPSSSDAGQVQRRLISMPHQKSTSLLLTASLLWHCVRRFSLQKTETLHHHMYLLHQASCVLPCLLGALFDAATQEGTLPLCSQLGGQLFNIGSLGLF